MNLGKGEIIELDKNEMFSNGYTKDGIITIRKGSETDVIDIQSETGFVQDANGIVHKQCGSHSIVYIIKNGLRLPTTSSVSGPAKSCEVLIKQITTFLATVSSIYSGAAGLTSFNTFIAPFLVGMTDREIRQIAQSVIFNFSQSAFSKGGQVLFLDLNLDITVPKFLRETKAVGPNAKYYNIKNDGQKDYLVESDKKNSATYYEYNKYVQKMMVALMDVFKEGCADGVPFSFPKALCHFDDEAFEEENKWVTDSIFECAEKNGSPYFLFDRGSEVKVAQCCRLSVSLDSADLAVASEKPENSRFAALQNVTINLPHAALSAIKEGEVLAKKEDVIENIKDAMDIALIAHKEKFKYIKKLYNIDNGPLELAKYGMTGEKYIDLNNLTYLIGLLGLDECVQVITGHQLHESDEDHELGIYIIAEMSIYCEKLAKKSGLKMVLEESPAESVSMKFAMTDCQNKDFGHIAKTLVKGNYEDGSAYWMNSVHFDYACDMSSIDRIAKQSMTHKLVKGGSIINLFTGEAVTPAKTIENLITKVHKNTDCTQLTISPEFTICEDCHKTYFGLDDKCKHCGSLNVYNMTRIVGYYSVTRVWSKGKKEELRTRNKEAHKI